MRCMAGTSTAGDQEESSRGADMPCKAALHRDPHAIDKPDVGDRPWWSSKSFIDRELPRKRGWTRRRPRVAIRQQCERPTLFSRDRQRRTGTLPSRPRDHRWRQNTSRAEWLPERVGQLRLEPECPGRLAAQQTGALARENGALATRPGSLHFGVAQKPITIPGVAEPTLRARPS